jgi:hypothetical protein
VFAPAREALASADELDVETRLDEVEDAMTVITVGADPVGVSDTDVVIATADAGCVASSVTAAAALVDVVDVERDLVVFVFLPRRNSS